LPCQTNEGFTYLTYQGEPIEHLANKTPAQLRAMMLAYWQKKKSDAEQTIKWGQDDLAKAKAGIQIWSQP
jgi:hypothetical protein